MPPADEALEFLESLIIFDQICPFAVEHLPVMSRRVFDVGLDMNRMRNSLKPHKGGKRSKGFMDEKIDGLGDGRPDSRNGITPQAKRKNSESRVRGQGLESGHGDNAVISPAAAGGNPTSPRHPNPSPKYRDGERSLQSSQLDGAPGSRNHAQEPDSTGRSSPPSFDLKPPPPNIRVKQVDDLSEKLFSGGHLRVILQDPSFFLRFTAFLNRYRANLAPVLIRYLEAQKAIKAIEYANALSESVKPMSGDFGSPGPAASIDPSFDVRTKRAFDTLVTEALPAYVTNCLAKTVTEYMVREVTGTGVPVMRELVGGLAEVFCLADPSIQDCPIVYASEEFYRTSRYSRDDVLGRNCRFLQGSKSDKSAIARLSAAVKSGQEVCETVLNYRRDGSPFINLLLIAPLYDNRGSIRYFIGAQIDVSGLIEDGRGLDSFERFLSESRSNKNEGSEQSDSSSSQRHIKVLEEFGQMLSVDESAVFQRMQNRTDSIYESASNTTYSTRSTPRRRDQSGRRTRRVIGDEEENENEASVKNAWALSTPLSSGRLPGVYQNVKTLSSSLSCSYVHSSYY